MCSLRLQFADLLHELPLAHINQTGHNITSIRLELLSFSRNKLIPIVLSQSSGMFSVWLPSPATCRLNLNSQTTWLKVKLKICKLLVRPKPWAKGSVCSVYSWHCRLAIYIYMIWNHKKASTRSRYNAFDPCWPMCVPHFQLECLAPGFSLATGSRQ